MDGTFHDMWVRSLCSHVALKKIVALSGAMWHNRHGTHSGARFVSRGVALRRPVTPLCTLFTGFSGGACRAGRNLGKGGDSYYKMKWTHHLVRLCDVAAPGSRSQAGRPPQPSFLLLWAAAWAARVVPVASPSPVTGRDRCACAARQLSGVIGAESTSKRKRVLPQSRKVITGLPLIHQHQQVYNFVVNQFILALEKILQFLFDPIKSFSVVGFCFYSGV